MEKKIFIVVLAGCLYAPISQAASERVVSSRGAPVDFVPGAVVITAVINQAHNPLSVMNATTKKDHDAVKKRKEGLTVPSGKSTRDPEVCSRLLEVPLEHVQEVSSSALIALGDHFHLTTGHGTYLFMNTQSEVAAYVISRDGSKILKRKPLLRPWPEERRVELVVGHDGKMEMRVPGSLIKTVRSSKSVSIKK